MVPTELALRALRLSCLLALVLGGCVTGSDDPRIAHDPHGDGPFDDPRSDAAVPAAVRRVLASAAYLDAIAAQQARAASPEDAVSLSIGGFSESESEGAREVRLELVATPIARFPAISRTEAIVRATVTGSDGELRVDDVSVDADAIDAFVPDGELDPAVSAAVTHPDYLEGARSLLTGDDAKPDTLSIGPTALAGGTLVIDLEARDASAPGGWRKHAEVVATIDQGVEDDRARVTSLRVWRDGVVVSDRLPLSVDSSFFPGDGYFVIDDATMFVDRFWAGYGGVFVPPLAPPHIDAGEMVVGLVVSYFPYATKSMTIEAVEQLEDRVVVRVALHWAGFACHELIDEVQLIEVVEIPRTDLPVEIEISRTTGRGCDGLMAPARPPQVSRVTVDDAARNLFHVCEATGRFDQPFVTCAGRTELRAE